MIKLNDVSVSFGENRVLDSLSAELPDKGIVLLTGPSGSGKTTVLRLILGLQKPDSGEILLSDNIKKISTVFQEDRLVPTLSALENVALVSDRAEAQKRLSDVGLADALNLLPEELSGGMKRRVSLARALAFSGDLIILDEAFTGIEEELCKTLLSKVVKEYSDRLIIAVTHLPSLFAEYDCKEIKL